MGTRALAGRLAGAGHGLSEGGIQWGVRPAVRRRIALTGRDIDVLAAVEEHGYLTTSMVCTLFWGSDSSAVRRRLRLLHDAGLLDKFRPATGTRGSEEWIYRVTELGWLRVADDRPPASDCTPRALTDIGYVEHDLQLSGLLLGLAVRAAGHDPAELPAGGVARLLPFRWHGPQRGVSIRASSCAPARPPHERSCPRDGRSVTVKAGPARSHPMPLCSATRGAVAMRGR